MTSLPDSLFPSVTLPWVNLTITEHFSLPPKRDNRFPDFENLQQARLHKEHQERRRGPIGICKMPSKPGRDDRMTGSLKHPFLNLSEACTYVPGESAIDGYTGHMVSRMPEPLQIGFRFTHTLAGCRIAGLLIDADDFPSYHSPSSSTTRRVRAPHKPSECLVGGWLGLASRRSFPWP